MNATPLRRVIAVAVSAAVLWSPAAPAAAQFRTAPVAAPSAPVVAPIAGALAAPLSRPVLGSLSAPTLSSLTPALPGAVGVKAVASVSAALPAAAIPAALSAPTNMPVAVVEAAGAAAPVGANPADQQRGSTRDDMAGLSKEVADSVEAAGNIAEASPAEAQGLGSKLMDLLLSPFKRKRNKTPEPTPQERRAAMRRIALNAASDERAPAPQADPRVTQAAMVKTLDFVAGVFTAHYAPLDWKKATFGTQIKAEYEKAKAAIESNPAITTRDFQDILAGFVTSLRDYHVGIQFYSTEMSMLPFSIMEAGGKYYLAYVDRETLPEDIFPFKPGDEVVEFDGVPTADAIAALLKARAEGGAEVTDRAMAARRLTRRIRQGGDLAPQGPVTIAIRAADGRLMGVRMEWQHVPEMIPTAPVRDGGGLFEPPAPPSGPTTTSSAGEDLDSGLAAAVRAAFAKLIPSGLNPQAALMARKTPKDRANPFQIGGRESFVPVLGEILWKSNARSAFNAYIYKAADGRKIGYVRIGSFEGEAKEAEAFGQLVKKFEAETDALVIDQVNNPGGSLFYMYALLSHLTDKPLNAPTQKVAVGEEDAYESLQTLMAAQQVTSEAQVKQILGPSIGGYVTTLKLWKQMVAYAAFIYQELRAGKRLTDVFPFLGIDKIAPHPTERYTKPILLLINELDFSCGDF
ncbi:protease-like activity factor CPAF, partial [bacterium]